MKIFVTVGSMTEKNFSRLLMILDELCEEGFINGKDVTAQIGLDKYRPGNYMSLNSVDYESFINLIRNADVVITHAGTGTVTQCLKMNKKIIVFPRLVKFDEHFDNHQLELSEVFEEKGYVLKATNKKELIQSIKRINNFAPQLFISNNSYINQLVIDHIESTEKLKNGVLKRILFK